MAHPELTANSARYRLAFEIGEAGIPRGSSPRKQIAIDPGKTERGLLKLVLTIVELIRQVLEKQAIRRIEAQSLTSEEVDRVGRTLMELAEKVHELQRQFEIDDLNIDLGPLGKLLEE
jgi:hypothetical protein